MYSGFLFINNIGESVRTLFHQSKPKRYIIIIRRVPSSQHNVYLTSHLGMYLSMLSASRNPVGVSISISSASLVCRLS